MGSEMKGGACGLRLRFEMTEGQRSERKWVILFLSILLTCT
jgi:hypothetical protein